MTEIWTKVLDAAVGRFKVSSVLSPLMRLTFLVTPLSLYQLAAVKNPALVYFLMVAAILPPAATIGAYAYFMIKDPSKLRSEPFEIKKQALEMIQEKGGRKYTEEDAAFVNNTAEGGQAKNSSGDSQ